MIVISCIIYREILTLKRHYKNNYYTVKYHNYIMQLKFENEVYDFPLACGKNNNISKVVPYRCDLY